MKTQRTAFNIKLDKLPVTRRRNRHKIPHLTKKLFTTDIFLERENQFLNGVSEGINPHSGDSLFSESC